MTNDDRDSNDGFGTDFEREIFTRMLDMLSLVEEDGLVNADATSLLITDFLEFSDSCGLDLSALFGSAMALAKTLVADICVYTGATQSEVIWNLRERLR